MQLRSLCGLLDALLGDTHPCIASYHRFLRQYDCLQIRLEGELEFAYGRRLAPSLVLFQFQMMWRNWFLLQLDVEERYHLPEPDFCPGLNVLQSQNNLSWLPTFMNVPSLRSTPHGVTTQVGGPADLSVGGGGGTPAPARWDPGGQVRNPSRDPHFTGETPLAVNVRSQKVAAVIDLAAPPSSSDAKWSEWICVCVLARMTPVLWTL
jgi:hypothetical protein